MFKLVLDAAMQMIDITSGKLRWAFISQKEDGKFITYNCTAIEENNKIVIKLDEGIIEKVHINLKKST